MDAAGWADRLFVNRRTYAAYEIGVNNMSPETLIKLTRLYKTSVDYLLGLTDNPKPYTDWQKDA